MFSMVIVGSKGFKHHHLCFSCRPTYIGGTDINNAFIPIYTQEQAVSKGWGEFCTLDRGCGWICPNCWGEHDKGIVPNEELLDTPQLLGRSSLTFRV